MNLRELGNLQARHEAARDECLREADRLTDKLDDSVTCLAAIACAQVAMAHQARLDSIDREIAERVHEH